MAIFDNSWYLWLMNLFCLRVYTSVLNS